LLLAGVGLASADRFLLMKNVFPEGAKPRHEIVVALNWFGELARLAPPRVETVWRFRTEALTRHVCVVHICVTHGP
jgi:hypothetical protein